MRGKHAASSSAIQQERRRPRGRQETAVGVFHCLVVSACPTRRHRLALSASLEGWTTVVCGDAVNARAASQRRLFGLAMVDLGRPSGGTPRGFREMTEQLADMSGMLVVVCGHQNDPDEEVWARTVGAWVYLPGTEPEYEPGTICREAMQVARRLKKASRQG